MKSLLRFILVLVIFLGSISACLYSPRIHAQPLIKEALFYDKLDDQKVQCQLCPRRCVIPAGRRGFCGVRENRDGTLYTLVYAKAVAAAIDPIEKKPLFHFLPGANAFSVATAGCNLKCQFCQNWHISQSLPEEVNYIHLEPQDLVRQAWETNSPAIAYTYNEPTIFYEYMLEAAKLARQEKIKNIMHSSGYINPQPLRQLCQYLDAANIDLKGFSDDYYKKLTEGSLNPVLESLKILKAEGVHLEITNLVLPGYNDDPDLIQRMCLWIKENLGADTPLHFSRFSPMYKLTSLIPTPIEALERARAIAMGCGLKYVYIGNVPGHPAENTYCPNCKKILIARKGYFIQENNIESGRCKFCGEKIAGKWYAK